MAKLEHSRPDVPNKSTVAGGLNTPSDGFLIKVEMISLLCHHLSINFKHMSNKRCKSEELLYCVIKGIDFVSYDLRGIVRDLPSSFQSQLFVLGVKYNRSFDKK